MYMRSIRDMIQNKQHRLIIGVDDLRNYSLNFSLSVHGRPSPASSAPPSLLPSRSSPPFTGNLSPSPQLRVSNIQCSHPNRWGLNPRIEAYIHRAPFVDCKTKVKGTDINQ
ncbi:putative DNA replication licensing factor MCM3 [Iris pallida]|uniref:DNA replication licensing factor MCM3 n=1 Tax=Iris pallida TaxID=29817 RepID=A0AAX6DKE1_IRIPA|nr:putative DNA replication licensing factor MCM3 [Iris pallida]KAJ6831668.1 putative DNA replication licensing factor MCM3 [Iris pallida]KAJ6841785.1 putative DNA replication licensing factor MCM3 [Iris pallida]